MQNAGHYHGLTHATAVKQGAYRKMALNKNTFFVYFASLLSLCFFVVSSQAATLEVKKDGCGGGAYCRIQEAVNFASPGDTIKIYPATSTSKYFEAITLSKRLSLIGVKSDGNNAWTESSAGAINGPVLSITNTADFKYQPIITIGTDTATPAAVELKGLSLNSVGYPITCTAITSTSYVSITYCDFTMGVTGTSDTTSDSAIAVYDGYGAEHITVSFCTFTGQSTRTTNWFTTEAGSYVTNTYLTNNQITKTSSHLNLGGNISHIKYDRNTFNDTSNADGYIRLSEPSTTTGKLSYITVTNNTFSNGSASNQYAVSVNSTIEQTDIQDGDWKTHLHIQDNKLLQSASTTPLVGFTSATYSTLTPTYYIDARYNYWNSTSGPSSSKVSSKVDYTPWYAENFTFGTAPDQWGTNDSIQELIDNTNVSNNDTIYVVSSGSTIAESVTITKNLHIVGKESDGSNGWTAGTAGAASGAPTIGITDISYDSPLIIFTQNDSSIKGFNITTPTTSSGAAPISCTTFSGTLQNVSVTYCSYTLHDDAKGIAINNGNSVNGLSVTYCSFTGDAAPSDDQAAEWFFVGDDGSGGAVNGVDLSRNTIISAMARLQLNNTIKNIHFSNNTFSNSWSDVVPYYGYVYIEEPDDNVENIIQGITLTHNTFNNGSLANEFTFLISSDVEENDVGNWAENMALHFNNFLMNDVAGVDDPIVGFEDDAVSFATSISATRNWWNSSTGPRSHADGGSSDTVPDVSSQVTCTSWVHASYNASQEKAIDGGTYAFIPANTTRQITSTGSDTTADLSLHVKTGSSGGATFIPTKYLRNPTQTSSSALFFYDLGIKSGLPNIERITATFYYTGSDPAVSTRPAQWYNGSTWGTCSHQTLNTGSNAVIVEITGTTQYQVTPTLADLTTIHDLTQTFFALNYTTSSSSSTSSSSTTTSTSGASGSTSSSSSTTSTGGGSGSTTSSSSTTTTTAPSGSTTTTTAGNPRLSISPDPLSFADNETAKMLSIANTGTGTLTYTVLDNETEYGDNASGWIFAATPETGSVQTLADAVTITVSRRGIAAGSYSAVLPVTSNAGSLNVDIAMDVAAPALPALAIIPRVVFFTDAADNRTITIRNILTGALTWQFDEPRYFRGDGWLSISRTVGYTEREKDSVVLSVDRTNLAPGLYTAALPLRSNAGTKNITVIMINKEGPELGVTPAITIFTGDTTQKTFNVVNEATGTLTWEIGDPQYSGPGGWITAISPAAGSVSENEQEIVTLMVSREDLGAGIYRAKLPVEAGTGETKNVHVFLVVPFF